ncbi:uncharacterized protein [Desmodus rotundus]|uniref:uncharacterized protein isoform X2 n=1 Tax=Desmodus rotundus TaxID=9430 RepID=UPI0039E2CCB9
MLRHRRPGGVYREGGTSTQHARTVMRLVWDGHHYDETRGLSRCHPAFAVKFPVPGVTYQTFIIAFVLVTSAFICMTKPS